MLFYVVTVAVILGLAGLCMVFASDEDSKNVEFLNSYGWECESESIESASLKIPEVFDEVYSGYNELQLIAGLDLTPYKGKKAVRYTYLVTNFPDDTGGEPVRANVLCVDSQPVAGDVMTVRLDGFMYSLNYMKTGK